jgi:phage-related baseplate assembly protein
MPAVLTNIANLDDLAVTVANITPTQGGLDLESDDRFRSRIKIASNKFSSAGPRAAYEYFTKSVRQDIVTVGIHSPSPGSVHIYPLLESGLPDQKLLVKVFEALNSASVRPLTDELEVISPTQIDYSVTMHLKLVKNASQSAVFLQVEKALKAYAHTLQRTLGRELVASQWESLAQAVPGVYRVWCDLPEESSSAKSGDWLHNTGIHLVFEGFDPEPQ